MKFVLVVCLWLAANLLPAQPKVLLVDVLEPVYPDTNVLDRYSNSFASDVARNGTAEFFVVIESPVGEEFEISLAIDGKDHSQSYLNELIDVPVEQNTGLDSRTEQFKGDINPHVIRRAPFRIYEAIKPLSTGRFKTTNPYTAFLVQIPAENSRDGKMEVGIDINGPDWSKSLKATFKVHDVLIPSLRESSFFYTNWFNLNQMEVQHILERWSEEWFEMLKQYATLMAQGRQNAIIIPGELLHFTEGRFVLEEERLIQFIDVFRNVGFSYFESPHLAYRGDKDDWGDPELKVYLTKNGYNSEAGKQDISVIIDLIKDFTLKYNLTKSWLQHISDEPSAVQAASYKSIVAQVKSIYPEIRIMEATNDRENIAGAIDIWCPLINDFQENESFFREREKLGEEVLVYTCLIPGGKWLNRTLDMEKIRQVYFGWGAAHYNTRGYLHWGLNQYKVNPFEQSVIHHPSPAASANNFLPAGDTHVIYPGENGPLSSLRFEAHRLGIEDYELLQLLKGQNAKLTESLVNKLFTSYTEYELSTKKYRKVKARLLRRLAK